MHAQLRSDQEIRPWLLQGLWLTRTLRPDSATVQNQLDWAYRLAADGLPLLPVGVICDFHRILVLAEPSLAKRDVPWIPQWPTALARGYEDHVLGRLMASAAVERAADALQRFSHHERQAGFAFILRRWVDSLHVVAVDASAGPIRTIATQPPDALLAEGFDSLAALGPHPLLVPQYESLITAFRRTQDLLAVEDVLALEQRTALASMARYVAHRQVLQQMAFFRTGLPPRPPAPAPGRREVPTHIRAEDHYPVGGYGSIGTRGSIESLLHSQLAYMEPHQAGPDLFDIKHARDELYYYTRDDNQFLRRRRAFGIRFQSDLVQARVKDSDLPAQRGVMALAWVLTFVQALCDWLADDALTFDVVFEPGLEDDADIAAIILRDEVARGLVSFGIKAWRDLARTAQMHTLTVGGVPMPDPTPNTAAYTLTVNARVPVLGIPGSPGVESHPGTAQESWSWCMTELLRHTI
jgi:hypothetical protein